MDAKDDDAPLESLAVAGVQEALVAELNGCQVNK